MGIHEAGGGAMTSPEGASARLEGPITLDRMGSFFFGGRVIRNSSGDSFHGDHGYAQFFIPQRARNYPLIMWHGLEQSGKTWESTPDGRDGFWQIFTRRDWPVYILDQPRRGRAGRAIPDEVETGTAAIPTIERESSAWMTFRLGVWQPPDAPTFFPGVQFPDDPRSTEQLLRQQTPNTGLEPFPDAGHREFLGESVAELMREVGPAVLLTHSHSGQYGWVTAMKAPELVKAVVAFEPGEFAFPDDEPPAEVPTESELLASFMAPQLVAAAQFNELTKMPILIVLGDNIPGVPQSEFGLELWRMVKERAQQFAASVNGRGGDATLIELPAMGIDGNTHFPMADLNNIEVADLVNDFLTRKGLDRRDHPHEGPATRVG